jgi:hypothetical protein
MARSTGGSVHAGRQACEWPVVDNDSDLPRPDVSSSSMRERCLWVHLLPLETYNSRLAEKCVGESVYLLQDFASAVMLQNTKVP